MADQPRNHPDPSGPGVPEDTLALIIRYYDNDLDDAGLAQLREALTQSTAAREVFVRWGVHGQLLTESLSANYKEEGDDLWQGSPNVLAELGKLEQQAQASLVSIHNLEQPRYVGRWVAAVGALAAVVVIAVVLSFVFHDPGGSSSPTQFATPETPASPYTPDRSPAAVHVATLTAEQDAQWADADLRQGDALAAGQRLTLTHGHAEITTTRGAKAILEAPCTFELTSAGHALYLDAGKLVGICETESSKGFTVRTPHMNVIDLGTRFGVDATMQGASEVHVFEGIVDALDQGGVSNRLTIGEAVRADANGSQPIKADPVRFVSVQIDQDTNPDAASAGIARMTGGVQWSPMQPKLLESRFELAEGEDAYIYAELSGYRLGNDIPLTIHATGTTDLFDGLEPKDVPAGTVIRSYLVCLNGGKDSGQNGLESIASVRFTGEILGVVATIPHWEAFEQRLAGETDAFFRFTRVGLGPLLEGTDSAISRDEVFISEDRHTLGFRLSGVGFAEFLRVVVKEPTEEKRP